MLKTKKKLEQAKSALSVQPKTFRTAVRLTKVS